jgi:hypothetical protein
MLVGYGFLASAAPPGRGAHTIASNAKVPVVIVVTIFRFIDFPLRYRPITFETYTDSTLWIGFLISTPSWLE